MMLQFGLMSSEMIDPSGVLFLGRIESRIESISGFGLLALVVIFWRGT